MATAVQESWKKRYDSARDWIGVGIGCIAILAFLPTRRAPPASSFMLVRNRLTGNVKATVGRKVMILPLLHQQLYLPLEPFPVSLTTLASRSIDEGSPSHPQPAALALLPSIDIPNAVECSFPHSSRKGSSSRRQLWQYWSSISPGNRDAFIRSLCLQAIDSYGKPSTMWHAMHPSLVANDVILLCQKECRKVGIEISAWLPDELAAYEKRQAAILEGVSSYSHGSDRLVRMDPSGWITLSRIGDASRAG